MISRARPVWTLLLVLSLKIPLLAQGPMRLQEQLPPGAQYHVSSRVELSGTLTPPRDKADAKGTGESAKPLTITGNSAIEYDERILPSADR